MFDIGFSELFLTAVVALLVLGPERLPKAARFAGLWVRRARAQWYAVKSELESELADEDMRRSLHRAQEELREAQAALQRDGKRLRAQMRDVETQAMRGPSSSITPVGNAGAARQDAADGTPPLHDAGDRALPLHDASDDDAYALHDSAPPHVADGSAAVDDALREAGARIDDAAFDAAHPTGARRDVD
ncbi:Sec-independent protein translocase protein TatB [Lysobacter humi (ex Lee et al. 2017)]